MGLLRTVFVNCHCVERLNTRDIGGTIGPNHKRLHLTDVTACAEEREGRRPTLEDESPQSPWLVSSFQSSGVKIVV